MFFIRKAKFSDLPYIISLILELGYEITEEEVKERLEILNNDSNSIYAETSNNEVVGLVHTAIYNTMLLKKAAIIMALVVAKDYRRNGLGDLLINKAEQWAKENRSLGIRLYSGTSRTDAHIFYKSCGYTYKEVLLFGKSF